MVETYHGIPENASEGDCPLEIAMFGFDVCFLSGLTSSMRRIDRKAMTFAIKYG